METAEMEKLDLEHVANDLISALWNPAYVESTCDTREHHVRIWKDGNRTLMEITKVR